MNIISDLLVKYSFMNGADFETYRFSSANEILYTKPDYQILILDIKLEDGINGIDLAKKLRQNGYNGAIILATSCVEYACKGYEIEAVRYLLKPIKEIDFFAALQTVFDKLAANIDTIDISFNGVKHYVHLNDIILIESRKNIRLIHTNSNTYTTKETIASISKKLHENQFAAPHKSFLVNLKYVKMTSSSMVTLTNNFEIKISRGFQENFSLQLHKFISSRGRL